MKEKVGFVGLGIMGRPMAENLSRGYEVLGFDLDSSRFQGISSVGKGASVAEVAKACRTVCLSLPNASIVEQVATGDHGLAANLAPGSLVVDLSTSLPSVSRRIAKKLLERGIEFVDAPVSGGEGGAKTATLAIMLGGTEKNFERAKPMLLQMGKTAVRVGDVGAGGIAKLVNNMIVGSTFAVIAEGFFLAAENGVDLGLLYNSIREGWAGSKVLDVSAGAMIARDYTPGGTIDMLEKDLGYARAVAAESHVPVPMTSLAHELYVAGQASGRGKEAQPALIELWRALGGK